MTRRRHDERGSRRGAGPAGRRGCARPAFISLALFVLAGCYERDVNYRPFMSGLPNTVTATPATGAGPAGVAPAAPDEPLVVENEDGSVTLVRRTPQQLLLHVRRTLARDERDLFTAQVLSDRTRREYDDRGLDPRTAFDDLKKREADVVRLLDRMPLGEQSPNVIMEKLGRRMYRVQLTGLATRGLAWTSIDVELEFGQWKLRWFGG